MCFFDELQNLSTKKLGAEVAVEDFEPVGLEEPRGDANVEVVDFGGAEGGGL